MLTIPLSIVVLGLEFVIEVLRTFNSLPDDLREQIVRDVLRDKKIRDEWWGTVTSWWGEVVDGLGKVAMDK